jgi:hypothetical protein
MQKYFLFPFTIISTINKFKKAVPLYQLMTIAKIFLEPTGMLALGGFMRSEMWEVRGEKCEHILPTITIIKPNNRQVPGSHYRPPGTTELKAIINIKNFF